MRLPFRLLPLVLALGCGVAGAVTYGVNARHAPGQEGAVAQLLAQRNLRIARVDFLAGQDPAGLRAFARRVRDQGGEVQVVLQTSHQWRLACRPDTGRLEQQAYREALAMVSQVEDLVHDFELLNESQLRPEMRSEVPWNSAGASAAPYQGRPCSTALAAVLRGMGRAVAERRAASGQPLRRIVGVVGRDFGFLSFLRGQGVDWDVTGFHVYPHRGSRSLLDDRWYGPGGPWVQLAAFGRPVHVNEVNCGELYDRGYEDAPGRPLAEACLQGLARHLQELQRQRAADVEAVLFYELLDGVGKAEPENRFGLLRRLGEPRPLLFLATALAGGELAPQEREEVTRRGLLTPAQIDQARAAAALSTRCCRRAPAAAPSSR